VERQNILWGEKMNKKFIKCAIYTRKSTEEGLEQDFNSLDAQREACEAYIKSQQHEGWTLVDKQYNDGGFSGGTLERPAVKELFKDIEAGDIDIIVVYKVDRLTRSLMDFSKMVELFDKRSVSFVSITQQFNTTTSMGRLTLNVLLSFAQFEREVTGERIRDKVAASKKKGIWMGGNFPIGYELQEKKLILDKNNAEKIKLIFEKYLELKSVPELTIYLRENNIRTRKDVFFTKGALYYILQNSIYIGLTKHKDKVYEGEHQGIVDKEIFEQVRKLLMENRIPDKVTKGKYSSLLAGKIFDDKDNYMSPSHSNSRNRRYRYYVSQAIIQSRKHEAGSISKIPANEIERVVVDEIKAFFLNTQNIQSYISNYDVRKQKEIFEKLKSLNSQFSNIFVRAILNKIVIYKDRIEIVLCQKQLLKSLEAIVYGANLPEESKKETDEPILLVKNIKLVKIARKGNTIIVSNSQNQRPEINRSLLKAIAKSFYWNNLLLEGKAKTSLDIQKIENLNDNTYIKDILRLRFLAPDIIESILNGTNPPEWTVQKLFKVKSLDWAEQKCSLFTTY